MLTWILAKKDLRLLLRDPRSGRAAGHAADFHPGAGRIAGRRLRPETRRPPARIARASRPGLCRSRRQAGFDHAPWSKTVERDLAQTAGIRVEVIPTLAEAESLVKSSQRAAVIVFGPKFSELVTRSSFMVGGVNPLYRDGINFDQLDVARAARSHAVDRRVHHRAGRPGNHAARRAAVDDRPGVRKSRRPDGAALPERDPEVVSQLRPDRQDLGCPGALSERSNAGAGVSVYAPAGSSGLLNRGSFRYQVLVPSYTVMFAYFLVLTVGWLFVAERRQGTLKRLRQRRYRARRYSWASCCPASCYRWAKACSCWAPASWCLP